MRALLSILTLVAVTAQAQEADVTLHSTVTGSREQPRVLYIVPWQQPAAAELNYTLDNRIGEELFTPIDRDEFVRELRYREQLATQASHAAPDKLPGASPDNNNSHH